jgi:hypothetical protein
LLALDNVFSTKSEGQEVNLVWPNLFLIFDCPSSVYTAHDPEYTEEELGQMEEAASAQRREIENNPRQNDTNLISTDIHLDKVRKRS